MYLILPKTPSETEQIVKTVQAGTAFLGTLLLCLLGRSVIMRKTKTNLRNGLTGISAQSMEFSKDWIPGKWSDFSFWSEKWKELSEGFQMYLILPKTPSETEQIVKTVQAGTAFLGTLLLCLLGRSVIMRKTKTNKGGLSSGISGKEN